MLSLLPALTLFAVVMAITPGPNNVMLMTSGVNFGFARTLPHMWGVALGFSFMAAMVGLGLAGLFTTFPILFVVLKWVGAAYLVYLAIKIARSDKVIEDQEAARPLTFLQAAGFQWLNPKAWIIVISACATYAVAGQYVASILLVALVLGVTTVPCVAIWILFGAGLRQVLRSPRALRTFNYTMAALLIASLYPVFRE